jgi:two-component system, OmpR family, phosphate regulon response regulator PhoB
MNVDGLTIDPLINNLILSGAASDLTGTEYELLYFLAQRPDQTVTREEITRSVEGAGRITDRSFYAQISRLRRKLGDYASMIETVRGVGYRFRA